MFKFFLRIICILLFSNFKAFSLNLMDINDSTKDIELKTKYLSRYAESIYKSRVDYLKEKMSHISDKNSPYIHLGQSIDGFQVFLDNASPSSKALVIACIQDTMLKSCQNQLAFFGKGPFVLYKNPTTPLAIDFANLEDLSKYYWHTAAVLQQQYEGYHKSRASLSAFEGGTALLLEPVLVDEEGAIEDLAALIKVVRPHLQKGKLTPQGLKFKEKGDSILKDLALLSTAYEWRNTFSNPEIQKLYAALLSREPEREEKDLQPASPQTGEEKAPLKPINLDQSSIEKKEIKSSEIKSVDKPVSLVPILPKKEGEKSPTHQRTQEPAKPSKDSDEKKKTRPDEGRRFLLSFNGLFEDHQPAGRIQQLLNSSSLKESTKEKNSEKEEKNTHAKEEHKKRLVFLKKLMTSAKTHTINVEKTLHLLKYFGLVKEGTTSLNHEKIGGKPIEMWVNGKRTLLDVPAETLAVKHKNGGKRFFKPYVVQKIRKVLTEVGIDKLLEN